MNGSDPLGYKRSSLETQLSELNSRSRWYTTETWQLPLAFIAATGFLIDQVGDQPATLRVVLTGIVLAGLILLWHLCIVHKGIKRAVLKMQDTEEKLDLDQTAVWDPMGSCSMIALHSLYTLAAFVAIFLVPTTT